MAQSLDNEHASFRPPCWRWHLAGEILQGASDPDVDDSDDETQTLVAFRARLNTPEAIDDDGTVLATAYRVFADDGPERWELETRLLAGQTDGQIAERCGLTEDAVSSYESIFFDIRGSLRAWGYIRQHVVGAGIDCGFRNDELRAFWAWVTLSGQPAIIELLIDTFHRVRRPGEPSTLSVYLRPDADVSTRVQAFVASAVLPQFGPTGKVWTEINLLRLEAEATTDPDRRAFLLEQARNYHVRCARAYLAGKPLPSRQPAQAIRRKADKHVHAPSTVASDPLLQTVADDLGGLFEGR